MLDRSAIHSAFVHTFHVGDPPTPVTDAELDTIESILKTILPTSFRAFARSYGTVYAPAILEAVTDRELDHPDIQDFLSAAEIVTGTKGYWDAGMPDNLVGFASDCMGNMFAFERIGRDHRLDDLPVLFFDHDFIDVKPIAESFDSLLLWYIENVAPKTKT